MRINIDLSELEDAVSPAKLERLGKGLARDLSRLTHAKLIELANERLKTSRKFFIDNLSFVEDDGVYVISLADDYSWINDGQEPFNMIPGLVNGPKAKVSKDGHKYAVVPFKNTAGAVGPTQIHPEQAKMVTTIKAELKKQNISWGNIERDDQGRPKLGKLHSVNIKTPNKTKEGPYQGKGDVGKTRVGSEWAEPSKQPLLGGAGVYQHEVKNAKGETEVKRSVITFRVASESQMGLGMWEHPGFDATHIFEDTISWALVELHSNLIPDLIKKLQAK